MLHWLRSHSHHIVMPADPKNQIELSTDAVARFRLIDPPAGFVDDPYPWYAQLRRRSPVHRLGERSFFLSRYDDVLAAYRDPRTSSDKHAEFTPKFGDSPLLEHHTTSLVFNDPPLHTRVRRLIMGALNQRAIKKMEQGLIQLIDELLDDIENQSSVDMISGFAARIPIEVIGNLLNVPRDERAPLRDWSLAILSALEPVPKPQVLQTGNQAVIEFTDYLKILVSDRRQSPGDPAVDVLTRLIQGEKDGEKLTESELLHNCIFLLNAGHETTTNLIGNGLHALISHRDQLERLAAEPALADSAVEELLRFESPLQLNNRLTTESMTIGEKTIPAGTFLTLGVGAANRDPDHFDRAEHLDIGRSPNNHLAFGQGRHACSGMNVARLEGRIAFAAVARRFPSIDLSGTPERDPRIRFAVSGTYLW
ncbi:MAG: cytochrome P450 [Gammaproteobacteria bacterium]|nr:MAG: cytochrome P450 [Gammaproteobacteria bacterium]